MEVGSVLLWRGSAAPLSGPESNEVFPRASVLVNQGGMTNHLLPAHHAENICIFCKAE